MSLPKTGGYWIEAVKKGKEKKNMTEPVFRNRTKIPQTLYGQDFDSQSPITLQPGDIVKGEHFSKYAGKDGCLELVSEEAENMYTKKIQKEKIRFEKAKNTADQKTGALFSSILNTLNRQDPGWNLKPTDRDEIILFYNQNDKLFLNLETGQIEHSFFLTDTGRKGLKNLLTEVEKKKKKWLKIKAEFQKARARVSKKTDVVKRKLNQVGG
jgi:hypothetical protein